MNTKLFIKLSASLLVGAVSIYFSVHGMDGRKVLAGIRAVPLRAVLLYLALLAVAHLFRAWRWEFLLRPLGVSVRLRRMLLISSVGFMAILAFPVRLGEVVRPYLVTRESRVRMSAALGTVAVERIVDGLMLSVLFFVSYLFSSREVFSRELRFGAWMSLFLFVALTTFLTFAQIWTKKTIDLTLRFSLLGRLAPARVERIRDRIEALITGFKVMADGRNFGVFLLQSAFYWGANGVGMWLLARQMGLPISPGAAFTVMAVTGVVLSLPNSPGLVGQFHAAIKLGLSAYLPLAVVNGNGMAYAIVLHGIQTVWYVFVGLASLAALSSAGRRTSLTDAIRDSNRAAEAAEGAGAVTAADAANLEAL